MSLEEVLESAASEVGATGHRRSPAGTEWVHDGEAFAVVSGGTAEFRLDPELVAAALRTPDTRASDRGPHWVAFSPAELDREAIDRAAAWLQAAWRRSGGTRRNGRSGPTH